MTHPVNANPAPGHAPAPPTRRSFLAWATHSLGALFGLVLGVPAVLYVIDPRNRPAPPRDFRTVGKLSELQVNKPVQAVLRDIRRDAWTLYPNDVVGRVWMVKRDDNTVDVYTTICPHLGCSINFHDAPTDDAKRFICPCHNGTWDVQGKRVEVAGVANPAPRGMDKLELQLVPDPANEKDRLIRVKYQNFYQGRETQDPKA
jgi:menaquinol-cytochrome c reductase iron-sulfur subunit